MNWDDYPNFTAEEFRCKHSGRNEMDPEFMARLQALRTEYGLPMKITSGFRSPQHPIERRKVAPGAHASGRACDVAVTGAAALRLVQLAVKHGFTGIGVKQHTSGKFIHLDDLPAGRGFVRPTIWSYP